MKIKIILKFKIVLIINNKIKIQCLLSPNQMKKYKKLIKIFSKIIFYQQTTLLLIIKISKINTFNPILIKLTKLPKLSNKITFFSKKIINHYLIFSHKGNY